jgi:hypothetical protein
MLLWQLASWFIAGGIYGVLANRPEGRGDTARCFGASGVITFLRYVRLTLCTLPALMLILFVFMRSLSFVDTRLENALTMAQLVAALAIAFVPAIMLLQILWTIVDYSRVEITLRGDSHDPSVLLTFMRSTVYVLKRPITLVHAGLGSLALVLVTVGYMYLSQGHPMYGAEGAVTLFVIRQGVALTRTAIRFGVMAGQIELGKTRALPPRVVEPTSDATKS